jgi:hypothetical protein
MTRFLHTADWQIGRQFASFDPEHAPILAEARIAVVERLAALALEHRVDAVLVAGDVFDAQTVSERTLRRLFNALAAYSGLWLLIPGNHDAALAESVWTRAQRLGAVPPHVHLLLAPELRLFEAQGFAVLPAPLAQRPAPRSRRDRHAPLPKAPAADQARAWASKTVSSPPGGMRTEEATSNRVQQTVCGEAQMRSPQAPPSASSLS